MDPYDNRAPESYRSIAEPGDVSIEIERSRFIGAARRVTSEEEAQAFIASVRAEHPAATHVVWAYIIGPAGLSMRASDDGEPQGTAGIPSLEVLKKEGLTDVVLATVRYFGGVKLGAGGLIRAYTRAAAEAVRAGLPTDMVRQTAVTLTLPYAYEGPVSYQLNERHWPAEKRFDAAVHYDLYVPDQLQAAFTGWLQGLTRGEARFDWGALAYAPLPADLDLSFLQSS